MSRKFTVTMTTDYRTFQQEIEAYDQHEAVMKMQVWTFPHEKLLSWTVDWTSENKQHKLTWSRWMNLDQNQKGE